MESTRRSDNQLWISAIFLKNQHGGLDSYDILIFLRFDSAQCLPVWSHLFCEYLRVNEFLRENILSCLSGDQMGSINPKKWPKNLVTLSL